MNHNSNCGILHLPIPRTFFCCCWIVDLPETLRDHPEPPRWLLLRWRVRTEWHWCDTFHCPVKCPTTSSSAQVRGSSAVRRAFRCYHSLLLTNQNSSSTHQLSVELNRDQSWFPNIPYQAYVVKRGSRPRTFINSCISTDASFLDSVLINKVFCMIILLSFCIMLFIITWISLFTIRK